MSASATKGIYNEPVNALPFYLHTTRNTEYSSHENVVPL